MAGMGRLSKTLKDRGVYEILTTTMRGHQRPDVGAAGATWFIHTARCTYALDDDGFCREVIPAGDGPLRDVHRCHGAQFVACLDMRTDQGLVAEPRVGARALFVGRGTGLRMALIKTAEITAVEQQQGRRVRSHHLRATQAGLATIDIIPRPSTARASIPNVPVPQDLLDLLRS